MILICIIKAPGLAAQRFLYLPVTVAGQEKPSRIQQAAGRAKGPKKYEKKMPGNRKRTS
jgi:hypothetical protein